MNLGYMFKRKMYAGVRYDNDEALNDAIEANVNALLASSENRTVSMSSVKRLYECFSEGYQSFELKTLYPGLIPGMGYAHGIDGIDADVKTGMSFDYTTGLPVLPGSSVKGALRSRMDAKKNAKNLDYLNELWDKPFLQLGTIGPEEAKRLVDEIFEGERDGEAFAMRERDCFFDAFPVRIDSNRKLLWTDAITPHHFDDNHPLPDELRNPRPVKTLKVGEGVDWRFLFRLKPSTVIPDLTPKKKRDLFKQILVDWGIGAKVNVGYGNFEPERS